MYYMLICTLFLEILTVAGVGAVEQIWAKMIRENLPPLLIFEGDASWDVNIRKVMPEVNRNFRKLLQNLHSTALPNPKWTHDNDYSANSANDVDDTWQSRHWDVFSVGHCVSSDSEDPNHNVTYYDPYVAEVGETPSPGGLREIHKSNGIVCTAGYAITPDRGGQTAAQDNDRLRRPCRPHHQFDDCGRRTGSLPRGSAASCAMALHAWTRHGGPRIAERHRQAGNQSRRKGLG